MQRTMGFIASVVIFTVMAMGETNAQTKPSAIESEDLATLVKQNCQEIRKLRMEILQQGIEFQGWKINLLEKDVALVQQELNQLAEQKQRIHQQQTNLIDSAANPSGEADELRKDFPGNRLKTINEKQESLEQREMELRNQLTDEKNKLQELLMKGEKIRLDE